MAVTEDDILQFGYTRGCYKCTLMSTRDSRGKKTCGHSRGCKDRIKDCLKKTEHGRRRVEEAERRFAEESMTAGELEERKRQERQEYEERRRSERMSLRDLTPASCGIGRWILRVVSADVVYPKGDNELHCVLLSEDSALYCRGVAKRDGIWDEAFQKMVGKFEPRKIFEVSKVSFDEESDEALNSAPVKHVIDLAQSRAMTVPQGSVSIADWPTPEEDLAQLLEAPQRRFCDVTALVVSVGRDRTGFGQKIFEVVVRDGSDTNEGKKATATFTVSLPTSTDGTKALDMLQSCVEESRPVSFFGLVCSPEQGVVKISAGQAFFFKLCTAGRKAEKLNQTSGQLPRTPR